MTGMTARAFEDRPKLYRMRRHWATGRRMSLSGESLSDHRSGNLPPKPRESPRSRAMTAAAGALDIDAGIVI